MKVYGTEQIKKDLVWYLAGAVLPMLVLLLRSPIFTRVFSPSEYGQYTLVYLVFLYLSVVKLEWIRTSIWRYYLKYQRRGQNQRFWQAVSAFFLLSGGLIAIVTLFWYLGTANPAARELIVWGGANIITQELITILLIPKRIEGKSAYYNIVNGAKAAISFILLLVMTFLYDVGIFAFFMAPALVNLAFLAYLIPGSGFSLLPRFNLLAINDLKRFGRYGLAGTLTMTATYLLISSDRWIVNFYWGLDKTGIYNQTYMLGQMSIMAMITVLNASFNPYLLNNLERNRKNSDEFISNAFRWYFYLILPMAVYISLYAKPLSIVLLGPDFREAWFIIPFITFSFLLEGLCHFSSIKLKFFNQLTPLYLGVIIATVANVLLNLLLVPRLGYSIAAHTTLASYIILFTYYYFRARSSFLHRAQNRKIILVIITVLLLQVAAHFIIRPMWEEVNLFAATTIELILFTAVYIAATLSVSPWRGQKSIQLPGAAAAEDRR
ncbi:MAG: lipopolysaccharide biosynthesis protein [Bacteroidota bacterium]